MRRFLALAAAAALSLLAGLPTATTVSADPTIPRFWDTGERLPQPDLSGLERLRFLTTTDFPPFNFLDGSGRLTGFHIDLARAICIELDILPRCEVQALPFDELEVALARGDGEAIIAGLAVTPQTRSKYAFSRAYLQFPARFVMPKASAVSERIYAKLAGKRVGVLDGSAHEAMLRDYFPELQPVTYSRAEWLFEDLKAGKIDAAFGDGMRFSFWLAGPQSEGCCRFAGGPYLAPEYLGRGLAIASKSPELADAFDYALRAIHANGVFGELYLRYFPVSFF